MNDSRKNDFGCNTENKNTISQNFNKWNFERIKHKFYTNSLTDLKLTFYCDNNIQNKEYKPLLKHIEKTIKYILYIKKILWVFISLKIFSANKSLISAFFKSNDQTSKGMI